MYLYKEHPNVFSQEAWFTEAALGLCQAPPTLKAHSFDLVLRILVMHTAATPTGTYVLTRQSAISK
jgi:hypothetical protein